MLGSKLRSASERGATLALGVFFLMLAVPTALLLVQAHAQLEDQALRQTQSLAAELATRIDVELRRAVAVEEARSFGEYSFLVVAGGADANFVQRSPLAALPVVAALPGTLGYFQVDSAGELTTPLLPPPDVDAAVYGVGPADLAARAALETQIRMVLAENSLVRPVDATQRSAERTRAELDDAIRESIAPLAAPPARGDLPRAAAERGAEAPAQVSTASVPVQAQAAFDVLTLDAGATLAANAQAAGAAPAERQTRTEQTFVAEPEAKASTDGAPAGSAPDVRVRMFESELDPFELGLLRTGHFVLFRKVWRDGQRYIQGAVLDSAIFIAAAVEEAFRGSSVAAALDLVVAYQGSPLAVLRGSAAGPRDGDEDALLYRARLSPPFGNLELAFNVAELPPAAGSALVTWMSIALAAVLGGGFLLARRFALGQIRLARQQQDFVSAVSHELKTPLTSIRMYGEMLKAGWADDARKHVYYDYIASESERLSRLIDNVLELARLRRHRPRIERQRVTTTELLDLVRSKVATQVQRAGFTLQIDNAAQDVELWVDPDCFTQIVINLIDNALKFAARAEHKAIEIACRRDGEGEVVFTVRDYGPGIAKGQLRKIFELFYRPANELTRAAPGTGIGLALVRELTDAMGGRVNARNCEPGAELRVTLPVAPAR